MWYYQPFDAPLSEVFEAFKLDMERRHEKFEPSVYLELIKLACDQSYPLESILEPCNVPAHPFDYYIRFL